MRAEADFPGRMEIELVSTLVTANAKVLRTAEMTQSGYVADA